MASTRELAFTADDIERKLNRYIRSGVEDCLTIEPKSPEEKLTDTEIINIKKARLKNLRQFCLEDHPEKGRYKNVGGRFLLQEAFVDPCERLLCRKIDSKHRNELVYLARLELYTKIQQEMKALNLPVDDVWRWRVEKKLKIEFANIPKLETNTASLLIEASGGTFFLVSALALLGKAILMQDPPLLISAIMCSVGSVAFLKQTSRDVADFLRPTVFAKAPQLQSDNESVVASVFRRTFGC